jgi:hypothetical protein
MLNISELTEIYKNLLINQYGLNVTNGKVIDANDVNAAPFNFDGKHIYLFKGSIVPDKFITNIVKIEFTNLKGYTFNLYSDFSTTENNNFANVCILFNKALDNSKCVLLGLLIEFIII